MFTDQSESVQIVDISPGNKPDGLFWTVPIPSDSVKIDLDDGRAEFSLDLFETVDFHDFLNNLLHGDSVPVVVSFNIEWRGKLRQFEVQDATNGFEGAFVETGAAMEWFASEEDFSLASAPSNTSTRVAAILGRERNGIFFGKDEHDNANENG